MFICSPVETWVWLAALTVPSVCPRRLLARMTSLRSQKVSMEWRRGCPSSGIKLWWVLLFLFSSWLTCPLTFSSKEHLSFALKVISSLHSVMLSLSWSPHLFYFYKGALVSVFLLSLLSGFLSSAISLSFSLPPSSLQLLFHCLCLYPFPLHLYLHLSFRSPLDTEHCPHFFPLPSVSLSLHQCAANRRRACIVGLYSCGVLWFL